MQLSYNGLFSVLEEKGINKTELKNKLGISSATLAKLSKNEPVSMKVIGDICNYLGCQIGDVVSMEKEVDKTSLLYRLREEKKIKLKGGIYHQTQIKLAYNSNHIEGSTLSEDQTRYIFETNTVGLEKEVANVDDIIETINHFICFDYMLDCAEDELSETIIKKMHWLLKSHTSDSRIEWFHVGEYKQRANVVGGEKTTPPGKVRKEIQNLLREYNQKDLITLEDIIDFHYCFEQIHPFQDGNGRVGRLIMFKECLKYNIIPFIIEDRNKMYYYRGLKNYKEEKGWLADTCLLAQDNYKLLMEYFDGTE